MAKAEEEEEERREVVCREFDWIIAEFEFKFEFEFEFEFEFKFEYEVKDKDKGVEDGFTDGTAVTGRNWKFKNWSYPSVSK